LRSFVILAEELHFGRASERLSIVQPALSMQIKGLEQELGVQLFIRDRHQVKLSPSGLLFLAGARATLDQAQLAVQQVHEGERGEIGRLRIGFISSVLPWYLPTLIRRLHTRFPKIELDLKDMPTPDQVRGLHEKQIDFGFARLPIDEKGIELVDVLAEPFIVALPEGHALTDFAEIAPSYLSGHPCLLLARRFAPGFCDELLLALTKSGLIPRIERELGEYTTMLALVGAGMGIGILPKLALAACPPGVTARPLVLPGCQSRVGLVWSDLSSSLHKTFHREALAVGMIGSNAVART
jgi:DNA-binding transcriptional LysR family regulator